MGIDMPRWGPHRSDRGLAWFSVRPSVRSRPPPRDSTPTFPFPPPALLRSLLRKSTSSGARLS